MKINIGSGNKKIDGFINLDLDSDCNPDYVIDLEKDSLPFEDSSVEIVAAHHILEHLGEGYFFCLKELYRVCKNEARIYITAPHPRHDNFLHDPTHKRPITARGLELFSKKYNNICLVNNFSDSKLGFFYNIDFELVSSENILDKLYLKELNDKNQEYLEKISREKNNIVASINIVLKCVKNKKLGVTV